MKKAIAGWMLLILLSACASYSGRGLQPGQATQQDVVALMGQPALQRTLPDGSQALFYPHGPAGLETIRVRLGRDGKLERIDNVLQERFFSGITAGMSADEVQQIIGPPTGRPVYYSARDELVWEWPFCDTWRAAAYFYVLFDGSTKKVRSTMAIRQTCGKGECVC